MRDRGGRRVGHRAARALALVALLAATARADDAPPALTMMGSGKVSAAPDMATVSAGVVTEAARATDAVRANSAAMQKVLAALDASGIPRKDVQTSRLDVSPVYAEPSMRGRGPAQITGYRASNEVRVEVHAVDKVGAVLDALVAAGANDVGGISFGIADPAPLLDEARKRAVADARHKAELYAHEIGVPLGRVIRVDEAGGGIPGPLVFREAKAAAQVPVAPGEVDVDAAVTISWSLAP